MYHPILHPTERLILTWLLILVYSMQKSDRMQKSDQWWMSLKLYCCAYIPDSMLSRMRRVVGEGKEEEHATGEGLSASLHSSVVPGSSVKVRETSVAPVEGARFCGRRVTRRRFFREGGARASSLPSSTTHFFSSVIGGRKSGTGGLPLFSGISKRKNKSQWQVLLITCYIKPKTFSLLILFVLLMREITYTECTQ